MTYSGSTQNSSYSKRTYNKKLSTDLADYAKALDTQRKTQVKEFQQQSKDQLSELERQDSVQRSNDKFQIAQLSKFSDTLNDFLETTAKTVGKAYIDNKRQEGVELYRRYQAGDKEAIAEVEANTEQLKEINDKVNSMSQEIGESTEAFLDRKFKEEVSLKDKIKALNIRKLSPNIRWGFVRAQLQEAGQGYNGHLIDTLHSSTEEFTTRDGTTYVIGNYSEVLNADHKKEIINYVEDQYIENNNPFGAADVVRNSYLTAKVVETTQKFEERELLRDIARQGEQEQTGRVDTFITAAVNYDESKVETVDGVEVNSSGVALTDSIQVILDEGPASEKLINQNTSPFKANKTRVIEAIKESISFLDEESAEDFVELLLEKEFKMAGMEGTLETLFAGDLNLLELLETHKKDLSNRYFAEKTAAKSQLFKEINQKRIEYHEGKITLEEYRQHHLEIKDNPAYNILRGDSENILENSIDAMKNWNPLEFNYVDSMKKIDDIMAETGYLTRDDIAQLDKGAREFFFENSGEGKTYKYKEEPIWNKVGKKQFGETVKIYTDKLEKSIDSVITKEVTAIGDQAIRDGVIDGTNAELNRLMHLNYLNGMSGTDAIKAAYREVSEALEAGTGIFIRDGDKFIHPNLQPNYIDEARKVERQILDGSIVTNKLDILQANGAPEDFLRNTILFEKDSALINLEKGEDGLIRFIPNAMFEVAEYSETGYTAIDIINMQRKLHGEEEYKLTDFSPELQALHTGVKDQFPHLAKVFSSGSEGMSLAIDEIGAVDLNTLLNASIINMDSPIFEGDLDAVLAREGIDKENYLTDSRLQEEVRRKQLNYLLKKAVTETNDKNQAILMVATGMRYGEAEMSNYGEGSIFDNKKNDKSDYAYAVLDAYYSGDTSKLHGKYNDEKITVANLRELTKTEARYDLEPNYVIENIVNVENMWDIDYRDPQKIKAILAILEDPQFMPEKTITVKSDGLFGSSNINNPLYSRYQYALKIYKSIDNTLGHLQKNNLKPFLTNKQENWDLVQLLKFQKETDNGGRPNNTVGILESPYYQFRNEWMEKNGEKFKGADKEQIKVLQAERLQYIVNKSREMLGFTEDD